ncbi:hypothetical protein CHS0354_026360 [Potamilus streckersoni]|uniref:Uncharacterized protein n=1 Tax=Potamilus streckersoni TaxID=2493646 RepID=A0AAE0T3R2_9BIVA|nr:hypothetical protein CHS0354_026360 [Potamilus streckersoni]
MDTNYSQSEIAKDNDEDTNSLLQALKTIKRCKIEHLENLVVEVYDTSDTNTTYCKLMEKHNTAKAKTGQERDAKWAETREWQKKYEILENNHKDLQRKFDQIYSEIKAMKDKNQMMDNNSKFYQAQLQEKVRWLQEHE